MTRWVLGTWLLLAAAGTASAQGRARAGGGPAAREEIFRMIDAYIVSNLQESLGLTDEQFVKLLPPVKRLQSERRAFAQKRFETLAEARRLLESGTATEPRIAELVRALKTQEAEEPAALQRDREAIDALLTPVQQAKFRILEARVEQRIRELVARGRGQGLGGGRSRGGSGALPEPDAP
jgi:Spy/CpxP family protein refolding chaperone